MLTKTLFYKFIQKGVKKSWDYVLFFERSGFSVPKKLGFCP